MGRRLDRQGMLGETGSGRNVGRHFVGEVQLPIGCACEQRDHEVLQRDDPDAKLHELGVGQLRSLGFRFAGRASLLRSAKASAAFVVPSRKSDLPMLRLFRASEFLSGMRNLLRFGR